MHLVRFAILAGTLVVLAPSGWAQNYPDKPIRMVISFPAGGPTDVVARLIATRMSDRLGQPVLADNKVGAGGIIAASYVAKSAADGYTVLLSPVTPHLAAASLTRPPPFDPIRDFTPISYVGEASTAVAVNADLPVSSIADLIDYAKRNPGN